MAAQSVLAFVIPRLVTQVEKAVSDCLYFVISTYSDAAESFRRYLERTGVSLTGDLEFTTQVVWNHGGSRPDIVGCVEEDRLVVIEAKFDAPLTAGVPFPVGREPFTIGATQAYQ